MVRTSSCVSSGCKGGGGTVGEELRLTEHAIAFSDAWEVNDSAVNVLRDGTLKDIARELV